MRGVMVAAFHEAGRSKAKFHKIGFIKRLKTGLSREKEPIEILEIKRNYRTKKGMRM